MAALPRIVIIGCGFGGLEAAKTLCGKLVDVTVIDRCNHICSSRYCSRSQRRVCLAHP